MPDDHYFKALSEEQQHRSAPATREMSETMRLKRKKRKHHAREVIVTVLFFFGLFCLAAHANDIKSLYSPCSFCGAHFTRRANAYSEPIKLCATCKSAMMEWAAAEKQTAESIPAPMPTLRPTPRPTPVPTSKPTPRPVTRPSSKSTEKKKTVEQIIQSYTNFDDFYEDYYDDFYDEEEAEDFYYDHGGW